jgi:hypothetical protein
MADSMFYYLAQTARTKLCHEVSSNHQDLRRILGHANLLDHLTAELLNRGYQLNNDEEYIEDEDAYVECAQEVVMEEDEPSCRNGGANPVVNGTGDDLDSEFLECTNCDVSDDENCCSHLGFYVAECFVGGGKDDYFCGGAITTFSGKATVQVSVQEVSDVD